MKRLSLHDDIPSELAGAIVALGNFDGFHRGHQAVVGRAVQRGAHERRPVIVATFDPHPVRLFRPDAPPFRLTSLDQRQELFAHAGADAMLVFDFTPELAATTAEEFVDALLVDKIRAGGIVTGDDFTFGKGRAGNVERLAALAAGHGIVAEAALPVLSGDQRISSGRIREALQAADPATATQLLTRPFAIRAQVIQGKKRGRDFGWPTANLKLGDYLRPAYGVYAVRVRTPDGVERDGVANLGKRPMFEPEELLEAHLFDFDDDLYGETVEVDLIHYLRAESKFESIAAMVEQIGRDAAAARALLAAGESLA